jgi:tetratricopeptide (TPR) repeat protein
VEAAAGLCVVGRAADARALLLPVLGSEPGNAEAWLVLSQVELMLGDSVAALRAAQTAGALLPADPRPCADAASALSRLGRHEAAFAAADRAVELEPGQACWHRVASMVRVSAGREPGEAMAAAQAAVRLAPEDAESHLVLGMVADLMEQRDLADRSVRRALELDPLNADAHQALARISAGVPFSPRRQAAALAGFAAAAALEPAEWTARHNFNQTLRVMRARAAYALLLLGYVVYRLTDYRQFLLARVAAPAGVLALAGYGYLFYRRLQPDLRPHIYQAMTRTRALPAVVALTAAVGLLASTPAVPGAHLQTVGASAAFAALAARIWLAVVPLPV